MKIQKIHIYNIASIEDETIDFSQEPIAGSDVFLITGKTGSGKSTILDAICLALYKTTPRLKYNPNSIVENNSDKLALNDSRRLMRQNTGSATVELWFEGVDGKNYLATWHVQRGKLMKLESGLDNVAWSLQNLSDNTPLITGVGAKDKDVSEAIVKAVGLEFDQFCRTTMLAQGEFTKFLKSDEKEKTAILAKITRFDEYSKIGKRIYDITREKKTALDKAVEAASDTGFDDKELAVLVGEIDALTASIASLASEYKLVSEKKDWLEGFVKIESDLKEKKADLETVEGVLQSEAFRSDEAVVLDWDKSVSARQSLVSSLNSSSKVNDLRKEIASKSEDFVKLQGGIAYAESKLAELDAAIDSLKAYLESEHANANLYANAQAIAEKLKQISDLRGTISDKTAKMTEEQAKFEEKKPAVDKLAEDFASAKKTLESKKDEVSALETQLSEHHLPELRKEKEDKVNLANNVEKAITSLTALKDAKKAREDKKAVLESTLKEIQTKDEEVKSYEQPIHDATIKVDACQEILDKQKESVDDWAKAMRSKLQVGDTCPVCQQKVQSVVFDENQISEVYLSAESSLKEAKDALDKLTKEQTRLIAEVVARKTQYNKDKALFDKDMTLVNAEANAKNACAICGLEVVDENSASTLESMLKDLQSAIDALAQKIKEAEKIDSAIKSAREENDSYQKKTVDTLESQYNKAKESLDAIANEISSISAVIKNSKSTIDETEEETVKMAPVELWGNDPLGYSKTLKDNAKKYSDSETLLNKKAQERKTEADLKVKVENIAKNILDLEPMWKNLEGVKPQAIAGIFDFASALLNTLTQKSTLLNSESENAAVEMKKVEDFLSQNPSMSIERLQEITAMASSIESIRQNLKTTRENHISLEAAHKQLSDQMKEHESKKPVLTETDTLENLVPRIGAIESEKSEKLKTLGMKQQILAEDTEKKSKRGELNKKKEEADAEYKKWKFICDYLGDANGTNFQKIAQSYILGGLLNSANAYLKHLAPRYTLKAVPGTLHISLEDAYQGFATRGTDSLSGGESFLVSLALALALSDIGQGLAVDTLFIDEGFGTLSGAPLTTAISTLRNLHDKSGRHVGIISHIEEVKENIPVQIQVLQEGTSSSSTIKIVPEV